MWKRRLFVSAAAVALTVAACTDVPLALDPDLDPAFARASGGGNAAAEISDLMDVTNAGLAADGADYRVAMAEYITSGESGEIGNTVIAKDVGNKQLSADFVPGDGRRLWSGASGNAITYAIDRTFDAVPPSVDSAQPQPTQPSSAQLTSGTRLRARTSASPETLTLGSTSG